MDECEKEIIHEYVQEIDTNHTTTKLEKRAARAEEIRKKYKLARLRRKESKKRERKSGSLECKSISDEPKQKIAKQTAVQTVVITDNLSENNRLKRAAEFLEKCKNNFSIIIDCDWEENHNDRSLRSLGQQIMFSYGANRKHSNPCTLYITGVGNKLQEQLNKVNCENWHGCVITKECFSSLQLCPSDKSDRKQLIYLTSDSDNTLDSLQNDCVYIIGGIVDRNRLKGATLKKATAMNVATAKLPIKENFDLSATHILTVNHVFEILLNYAHDRCWNTAMEKVLPKRKSPKKITSDELSASQANEEKSNLDQSR